MVSNMRNFAVCAFSAVFFTVLGTRIAHASGEQLLPENFSTPIAKKLAAALSNPNELKKIEVNFVNNSSASLKCKLSVNGIWEMVMRNKASLDFVNKQDSSRSSGLFSASMSSQIVKETALSLEKVDEYCGTSRK